MIFLNAAIGAMYVLKPCSIWRIQSFISNPLPGTSVGGILNLLSPTILSALELAFLISDEIKNLTLIENGQLSELSYYTKKNMENLGYSKEQIAEELKAIDAIDKGKVNELAYYTQKNIHYRSLLCDDFFNLWLFQIIILRYYTSLKSFF